VKTRAGLFRAVGEPLEVVELDLAEPGPNDVVVRMAAVGICGTDLHQVKGEWQRPTPMVLGHEGAGIIEHVGDEVDSLFVGDEVVLSWAPSCGHCADCARGRPAACVPLHRAIGNGTLVDGTTGMSIEGETVYRGELVWAGLRHGCAHERSPLPLALSHQGCCWRRAAIAALDRAGIPYRVAYSSRHYLGQFAAVMGGLAVAPFPRSIVKGDLKVLGEEIGLPTIGNFELELKRAANATGPLFDALASHIVSNFRGYEAVAA
jgi:hypothetical protein